MEPSSAIRGLENIVSLETMLIVLIFAAIVLAVFGVSDLIERNETFRRRLATGPEAAGSMSVRARGLGVLAKPIEAWIVPTDEQQRSKVRQQLMRAGYRGPSAVGRYYVARLLLGVGLPVAYLLGVPAVGGQILGSTSVIGTLVAAAVGALGPMLFVANQAGERAKQLRIDFPDALDLMLVCVESGLGLDAAVGRVGEEMAESHRLVAEEFQIMGLEMRAGLSREEALRHLAQRTGVEEISGFASLLIQSGQLGASIGEALRVAAEEMRTRRLLRAEEQAAKLPVKMIIPMALFMMPCMMIAIAIPAVIQIVRTVLPAIGG